MNKWKNGHRLVTRKQQLNSSVSHWLLFYVLTRWGAKKRQRRKESEHRAFQPANVTNVWKITTNISHQNFTEALKMSKQHFSYLINVISTKRRQTMRGIKTFTHRCQRKYRCVWVNRWNETTSSLRDADADGDGQEAEPPKWSKKSENFSPRWRASLCG